MLVDISYANYKSNNIKENFNFERRKILIDYLESSKFTKTIKNKLYLKDIDEEKLLRKELLQILKEFHKKYTFMDNINNKNKFNTKILSKEWAVKVHGGWKNLIKVINDTQLEYVKKMKEFNNIFVLREKNNATIDTNKNNYQLRSKISLVEEFQNNYNIEWIEKQKSYKRFKKDLISTLNFTFKNLDGTEKKLYKNKSFIPMFIDPLWKNQWQIHQYDEERKNVSIQLFYDMQIIEAWEMGYSGKGIVISILDDGIDYNHEDLKQNYESRASYDFNDDDNDPLPRMDDFNKHGTKCAGIIAMVANNTKCGVGVAFNSKVGGIRMLDGEVNDRVEAEAITYANQITDIFAASWGPNDDGRTVEGPGYLTQLALKSAVYNGREKKGSILVWASGNGGIHSDNCNCDGYAASIYTISVSGVTQNNNSPWYGEECSSTLVSAYSSGSKSESLISTTDLNNKCATDHSGTSASVPTVAGIIALTLEANNSLTWRDIQHLIVWTAEPSGLVKSSPEGWQINGAGFLINSRFGFGLINAKRMVIWAKNWIRVPEMVTCSVVFPNFERRWLTSNKALNIKFNVDGCKGMKNEINYIEQVQLLVEAKNRYRGNLAIWLESPKGTKTQLLHPRHLDDSTNGFKNWPFTSVQTWGENPNGDWTVHIVDLETEGFVTNLTFVIHGTKKMPKYRENKKKYNLHNIENYINQKRDKNKLINSTELLKYGKRFIQSVTENGIDIDNFSAIEQIIALHEELKSYAVEVYRKKKIINYFENITNAKNFAKSFNIIDNDIRSLPFNYYVKISNKNIEILKNTTIIKYNKKIVLENVLVRNKRKNIHPKWTDYNDKEYHKQWHILNSQPGSIQSNYQKYYKGMHILDVWEMGYTGKNVVVTIIDDGVDYMHPDLKDNYLADVSINLVENNYDPRPPLNLKEPDYHGTNCAGLISMKANNSICGVGIAFGAKFGAIRLISNNTTSIKESQAFSYKTNKTDIFSLSWGPLDDGKTFESPHNLVEKAINNGVMYGRKTKGSVFVFASGNGGLKNDSCAMDGLASHVFTFPVSAVGPSFELPSYSERCSTALISTFSNSHHNEKKEESLISTGLFNTCGLKSVGTSASAPLFAGILALVLEARSNLTWRDLKYITILTANPIPMIEKSNNEWILNGAGFLHNPYFGFGLANAKEMIIKAKIWEHVPGLHECQIKFQNFIHQKWTKNTLLQGFFFFNACNDSGNKIIVTEYVQLRITTKNIKRGSIQLWLRSPSNTQIQLIYERNLDNGTDIDNYAFNSVAMFGENPEGTWEIELLDSSGEGILKNVTFNVFGTIKRSKYLETKRNYGKSDIYKNLCKNKRNFIFKRRIN